MLYNAHELIYSAAVKLLCDFPSKFLDTKKRKLQVLAVHSSRFLLNLRDGDTKNTMVLASVDAHMRTLTHYDPATHVATSTVPSEPILAVAAGQLLLQDKNKYELAMQILVEDLIISDGLVSLGDKWETVARIILLVNRDVTVHAAGGQICVVETSGDTHKITEETYARGRYLHGNLCYAVRPFTLYSYLQNLVDQANITQVDNALSSGLDWAADVHMNFTHFVQLDDSIGPYLSSEFLVMCWRRGYALQCIHDQAIIDILLIGYRGDLSKPFNVKMFVFVALQVRNQLDAAGLELINTITCPFVRIDPESECWKPEYMVILMDMGTTTRFEDTERRVHVNKQEAVEGEAWEGFDPDKEYPAVRINIRRLDPYTSLAKWAPAILDLRSSGMLVETIDFSAVKDQTSLNATKGALTFKLSFEEMNNKYEKQLKGEIFDINDVLRM